MPKGKKLLEEYVSRIEKACGEGRDFIVILKYAKREEAIKRIIDPALKRYKPDIIFLSAGFDAHYGDPVGNMDVDSRTFWRFGSNIKRMVGTLNSMGSIWVLEGGYNAFVLGPCIEATLKGLMGKPSPALEDQIEREINEEIIDANNEIIGKMLETIKPVW